MYSKEELFALMVTKRPVKLTDRITGVEHVGVIETFEPEPHYERNLIVWLGDKPVYITRE